MKFMPFFGVLLAACPLIANDDFSQNGAPSYFGNPCRNEFFAEIDYLIWYAHQEGMAFATKANFFSDFSVNSSMDEKDQFFKHPWDSGVKASVGFKPYSKTWDTRLTYTFFYTKDHPKPLTGSATGRAAYQTAIIPDYVPIEIFSQTMQSPTDTFTYFVDPIWKLYFNSLDLDLGREFDLSCDAGIRPFFGLKALWTGQKFNESIHFFDTRTVSGVSTVNTTLNDFKEKNDFTGVGARTGLDINYSLVNGFDVFGNFAGSLLWGWFHVRQFLNTITIQSFGNGSNTTDEFKHSHQSTVFNFDISLGFRWNYWFNCDRNLLTVKVGWEQHLFTNINQFQNFIDYSINSPDPIADRNIERGDLTLSGWLLGLTYNF